VTYIHVIKFALALPDQCHVEAIFYVSLFVEDNLLRCCCERTSESFASCTSVAFVVSVVVVPDVCSSNFALLFSEAMTCMLHQGL
jgi:hypothetical protein